MNNLIKDQMDLLFDLSRGVKRPQITNLTPNEKLVKINGQYRIPEHDHREDGCVCAEYYNE